MPEINQLEIERSVDRILNRWPAVGLAVGVVRDGALGFFSGHGVADIDSATPVTEDTVFRIGSITKTFTAVAVMQLWDTHSARRVLRQLSAKGSPQQLVRSTPHRGTWLGMSPRFSTVAQTSTARSSKPRPSP